MEAAVFFAYVNIFEFLVDKQYFLVYNNNDSLWGGVKFPTGGNSPRAKADTV